MKKLILSTIFTVVAGMLSAGDGMSLYPNGDKFLFSGYSPSSAMYEKLKGDGFTAVGPVYSDMQKFMAAAKKSGLPVFYNINGPLGKKALEDKNVQLDPAALGKAITDEVKAAVAAYSDDIYAWYLRPEELRYWRKREFAYFTIATAAIRKADPLKRPVLMYNPGHYNAGSLQKYLPHLTMMGKGTYTNHSGFKEQRIWVRHSMLLQQQAITGAKVDIPFIAVLEMMRPPEKTDLPKIGTWVRHDVYCALVSGAKGIVIYSLWPRSGFRNFGHNEYYQAYKSCAAELTGKADLGKVFLHGKEIPGITLNVTDGQKEIELTAHKTKVTYSTVNFKALEYNGKKYIFAVNSANTPITCQLAGVPAKTHLQEIDGKRTYSVDDKGATALTFAPLEVLILTY
ncbi:MAG: hypothetical protein E7057_06075 [Lentisphaerae bacterium]|nr:hypothetical protein [Lentisphaerota bacterium]